MAIEMVKVCSRKKAYMMYLNTWIHLIDYFVVTYGHKSINDKMCFLHPLHLTQSPLEAYFSVLRGLDANSCITGGTLVHRIKAARVVSNNTLIKPRIRCSYDIEDIPVRVHRNKAQYTGNRGG